MTIVLQIDIDELIALRTLLLYQLECKNE